MTSRAKTAFLALSLICVLAAPLAEAARLGKGRSAGMQRATPTQSYQHPSAAPAHQAAPAPAATPATPAPQQKGSGIGGMLAAGAAGAAAGYLLSSAFGGAGAGGGLPWMAIIGGGLAGLALLAFFRNRAANRQAPRHESRPAPMSSQYEPAPASFGAIPPIGSGAANMGGSGPTPAPASLQRLPDGTEIPHFLRQAKATFLHLQNLNSAESLEEVRKYLTPDLFNALREDISQNTEAADFPQLDCTVIEATSEGGRMIASVRFSGTVSESVGTPAVPFAEVWHYVKEDSNSAKWLIAGIQQN